jgi:hypothetical protein
MVDYLYPTSSKHRFSSIWFSLTKSSRGYLSIGKDAIGQFVTGKSNLCMGLLCVTARAPRMTL